MRTSSTARRGGGQADPPTRVVDPNCSLTRLDGTCLAWEGLNPQPSHAASGRPLSTGEIAQQAASELKLPVPEIRMNPDAGAAQVVRVPTWLWIDPGIWHPVSKTVQVPGAAVTATATPQRVVWSMGDGGTVTCAGPGTPYSPAYPADEASPDCGYTYLRSSAGQPGETFTVTAAVVWTVVWQGVGNSGSVPGLATRSRTAVRVTEVQSIVVSRTGAI